MPLRLVTERPPSFPWVFLKRATKRHENAALLSRRSRMNQLGSFSLTRKATAGAGTPAFFLFAHRPDQRGDAARVDAVGHIAADLEGGAHYETVSEG